jgi:mannose-6-phosphate isomerase-like protein (cupin superfamily)
MTATIIDLAVTGQVDLTSMLTGPLHEARLITLQPGQAETLTATQREHTLFVIDGAGTVRSGPTVLNLGAGTAVTLPLGAAMTVTADETPLRYFHASLNVPAAVPLARGHA